jgi:hypothetical protein
VAPDFAGCKTGSGKDKTVNNVLRMEETTTINPVAIDAIAYLLVGIIALVVWYFIRKSFK